MANGTFTRSTCSDPLRRRGSASGDGHVLKEIPQGDFAKCGAMVLQEQELLGLLGVLSPEHCTECVGACEEVREMGHAIPRLNGIPVPGQKRKR